jgi:hypothetical protein
MDEEVGSLRVEDAMDCSEVSFPVETLAAWDSPLNRPACPGFGSFWIAEEEAEAGGAVALGEGMLDSVGSRVETEVAGFNGSEGRAKIGAGGDACTVSDNWLVTGSEDWFGAAT